MGLFDIFSNSDAQNAANTQAQYYQQGYNQLANLYGQGANALQQNYQAGLQPLQQNYGQSQQGVQQLMNLLGLNGANGSATAQQTLQNMPGYQFALNQGTQNTLRNQSATGQLNSGASNMDLTQFSQGLANQNYNNYVNQLMPFLQSSNQNAGGIANMYGGLGNQLSGLYQQQGNAAYGTQAGIGNAYANADYANLAQSGALFGGLLGLGSSALKAFCMRDAKDDITLLGVMPDGLGVYRYRYKGRKKHHVGFMIDEVEKLYPDDVKTGIDGRKYLARRRVS